MVMFLKIFFCFNSIRNSIQIQLYYDDFTVTNPIGTHFKNYKLSAVYFILSNLHPMYRSQLDSIQLVVLAQYTKVVEPYGIDALLKPILDDIKILESESIVIECHGQVYHFFGTISFIAADNLGAHSLGKFQECFSAAHKICRFCRATRADFQGVHIDSEFEQLTKQAYDAQVMAVEQDNTLVHAYGVKGRPSLNELQYYHIIDGLPSDIAHDCFEGIVPDITLKVLTALVVEDGLFTFAELNVALANFEFAAVDRGNIPPAINVARNRPRQAKLRYTQSQMWCFISILPFLIGQLVSRDNEHWDLFLSLLDMIECICAPAFSLGVQGTISRRKYKTKGSLYYTLSYTNSEVWTPN